MSTRDELRKVQSLRGDTYSSAEVIGLIGRAADEIGRLKATLRQIADGHEAPRWLAAKALDVEQTAEPKP